MLSWVAALTVVGLAPVSAHAEPARISAVSPPTPLESIGDGRATMARCNGLLWALAWPGLGQICNGKTTEGAVLASLALLEAGAATGVYVGYARHDDGDPFQHPGVMLPLVAMQDLWVYGMADAYLDRQRALHLPLTPRDSLTDLVLAPFDIEVMARPSVWAGILGTVGAALLLSQLTDSSFDVRRPQRRPTMFRRQISGSVAYPTGAAVSTALFTHVAIAEETIFRGVVQSSVARSHGAWSGFAVASLAFGATHLANLLVVEPRDRYTYATRDVPFITAIGSYLGLTYMWNDYSLAAPVAVHFWYDLLLSMAQLLWDSEHELFQVNFALPL